MTRPGLYVHVPFCSAICPYCDFAVRVGDAADGASFVDSVLHEAQGLVSGLALGHHPAAADAVASLLAGDAGPFDTIYFGGGTPSVLAEAELYRLVEGLRERLPIAEDASLFFEANPEDVTAETVELWRDLGVSMLSLGVQSFDEAALRCLGRRHDGDDARRAVELCLAAGLDTVSVDLIYGLPGQTADAWRRDLDLAIELGPQHLSCYELEIHPRTVFGRRHARGDLTELSEDDQADLFVLTHRHLAKHGFEGYEVSNFARAPEHRSEHNAKYWHHVPYLGLGPSAHSYAWNDGGGIRWWNERHVKRWARRLREGRCGIEDSERLSASDLAFESVMLRLRTVDGVDLDDVERLSSIDLAATGAKQFDSWVVAGLATFDGKSLRPTLQGMAVADRLAADLRLEPRPRDDAKTTTELDQE